MHKTFSEKIEEIANQIALENLANPPISSFKIGKILKSHFVKIEGVSTLEQAPDSIIPRSKLESALEKSQSKLSKNVREILADFTEISVESMDDSKTKTISSSTYLLDLDSREKAAP